LIIEGERILFDPRRNMHIIDLRMLNRGKNKIDTEKIKVQLTRKNKPIKRQFYLYGSDSLNPQNHTRLRIFFRLEEKQGISVNFKRSNESMKFILSRKYL